MKTTKDIITLINSFDFYISDRNGVEVYRLSRNVVDNGFPHEIVLTPGQAETTDFQWNQVTNLSLSFAVTVGGIR